MEFLPYISKWFEILLRWGHVFFSILWIGNSMIFNYLDNKMRKNIKNEEGIDVEGTLQHSGYYYKLTRYHGAPKVIPKNLIIFKWQSYLTFLTGVGLLIIIYYANDFLMLDKRVNENVTHLMAVSISIFSIVGSWIIYDLLCKSKLINYKIIFPTVLLIIITAISFGFTKIYVPRFAFLQMGIILGSLMTANVFFIIAPNGRNITSAALNKTKFDLNLSIQAKTRSVHNNIITLLVLFIMLSGHASFVWISKYNWLILAILAIIFGLIRYYFNWKNKQ